MRLAARLPESSICSAACLSLRAYHKSAHHRLTMEEDVCTQAACLCTMCTCWLCRGAADCRNHLHATLLPLSQASGHVTVCNAVTEGAAGCAAAQAAEVLSKMCCEPSCQLTAAVPAGASAAVRASACWNALERRCLHAVNSCVGLSAALGVLVDVDMREVSCPVVNCLQPCHQCGLPPV